MTDSRSKFKRKKKKNLKTKTLAQITRAGAIIVKDNIQVQQTRFLKKKKKKKDEFDKPGPPKGRNRKKIKNMTCFFLVVLLPAVKG